jgi:hypothetical protein
MKNFSFSATVVTDEREAGQVFGNARDIDFSVDASDIREALDALLAECEEHDAELRQVFCVSIGTRSRKVKFAPKFGMGGRQVWPWSAWA